MPENGPAASPLLEARDVGVTADGHTLVRGVSFSLYPGDFLMLSGPNGAGKSTLLSALSGAMAYTGSIRLRGRELCTLRPRAIARHLGMLMQKNTGSFDYTVRDVVSLGRYAERRSPWERPADGDGAISEALERTGMTELAGASMRRLSGGETQRAFLAQVFAQNPDVLLLDEPTNHLDFVHVERMFAMMDAWRRTPGRAVLCVVHDLSLARLYGDRILLMQHGTVAAEGSPDTVLTSETLRAVYGMDVTAFLRRLYAPWLRHDG